MWSWPADIYLRSQGLSCHVISRPQCYVGDGMNKVQRDATLLTHETCGSAVVEALEKGC